MVESIKKRWAKKKAYEVIINCRDIDKRCKTPFVKSNLHCLGMAILLIIFE